MDRKISLWLLPDVEDEHRLARTIEALSQQQGTLPFSPHLTLYSPIIADPLVLQAELDSVCKQIAPFHLNSQGIGHGDAYYRAIVIEIQTNPTLMQWHEQLRSRWNPTDSRIYAPHISLVYKKIPTKERESLTSTISYQSSYSFDRIAAVATETSDPQRERYQEWDMLWELPLTG